MVGFHVRRAVLQKARHAGNHIFAALACEKFLQSAVCKRRIFDVNFAHYAHFNEVFFLAGNIVEIRRHIREIFSYRLFGTAFASPELSGQFADPFIYRFFGVAFTDFVGRGLIFQKEKHIAVNERRKPRFEHFKGDFEPAVFFKPRKTDGDDRNEAEVHFFKRFSQQENIIRGSAASARLEKDKGGFVYVVSARFERV